MQDVSDRVERDNLVRRSVEGPAAPDVNVRISRRTRTNRRRPHTWVWAVAALGLALLAAMILHRPPQPAGAADNASPAEHDLLRRGKYLVTVAGCNDCHTPMKITPAGPVPDTDRLLSGHPESAKLPPAPSAYGPWTWTCSATNTAFAGPWGTTYATNLTPDKNTGTGIWTQDMFTKALKLGKHWGQPGARNIQPPMPWSNYAQMTDQDLKAVWTYLRSIPPIKNQVPDYEPPAQPGK